jgi:hypothetical protein
MSVAADRYIHGALARRLTLADFGYPSEDRGIEVPRPAFVADADWNVLQNHEAPFVPQRFPFDAARLDPSATVFAGEIVRGESDSGSSAT